MRGVDPRGAGRNAAPGRSRRDRAGAHAVEYRINIVQFIAQVINVDLADERGSGGDDGVVAVLGPGRRGKTIINTLKINRRAQLIDMYFADFDAWV